MSKNASTADLMIFCDLWLRWNALDIWTERARVSEKRRGEGASHVTAAHQLRKGDVVIHRAAATMWQTASKIHSAESKSMCLQRWCTVWESVLVSTEEVVCSLSGAAKKGPEESKCSKTRDAHHLINAPTQDKFQLGIKGLAVPQQALSRQGHHNTKRCATRTVVMLLITRMYTKGRVKI